MLNFFKDCYQILGMDVKQIKAISIVASYGKKISALLEISTSSKLVIDHLQDRGMNFLDIIEFLESLVDLYAERLNLKTGVIVCTDESRIDAEEVASQVPFATKIEIDNNIISGFLLKIGNYKLIDGSGLGYMERFKRELELAF